MSGPAGHPATRGQCGATQARDLSHQYGLMVDCSIARMVDFFLRGSGVNVVR
jgi:hypothetical protein